MNATRRRIRRRPPASHPLLAPLALARKPYAILLGRQGKPFAGLIDSGRAIVE